MKIQVPHIERPHFERPHLETPEVELPKIDLANVELPQWQGAPWRRESTTDAVRRRSGLAGIPFVALIAGAIGAGLAYFLDPERGRARRAVTRERLTATMRRASASLERQTRHVTATASGKAQALRHGNGSGEAPNDAVLAHRVESELFRDPVVPKGRLNINAEHGVVILRGSVDEAGQIGQLEDRALAVSGVVGVRNLLHVGESQGSSPA